MTTYQTCAETAQDLRSALQRYFPGTKFSVRSKTYSGGASINIRWTDGPQAWEVGAMTDKFQGSDFDGMVDLKTSRRNGRGADYVFTHRDTSPDVLSMCAEKFRALFGWDAKDAASCMGDTFLHRMACCWDARSQAWRGSRSYNAGEPLADLDLWSFVNDRCDAERYAPKAVQS